MELPFPHPLKDPIQTQREYNRVFDALSEGQPVLSHVWVVVVQKGTLARQWSFDQLPDFLALFDAESPDVALRKVWSVYPDRKPTARHATGNVRIVLRDGTPINLTDFIIACCQDKDLFTTYQRTIAKLVLSPFSILKAHRRGMNAFTRRKLSAIHKVLMESAA